jgi:hypothetical protein
MFHTYITATSGTVVDFDRASFLMDDDLLRCSIEAMRSEPDAARRDIAASAQWVWDDYCRRHQEHYGESFGPDVIPNRDSPPKPRRSRPPQRDDGITAPAQDQARIAANRGRHPSRKRVARP